MTLRLSEGVPPVLVDAGQAEQVLLNLVVNARDAMMPRGGEVVVETGAVRDETSRWARLTVRDTGAGIPRDVLPFIFEPYFTTKDPGKGTGLGLATVYGIVEQSKGRIEVESEPGQGASFRILLPAARGPAQAAAPRSTDVRDLAGSETLLVVEDDPVVLPLIRRILQAQGYRLLEARGGAEAAALADSHAGPLHLALIDMVMPSGTGPDAAALLRAKRPELRVLYMSGYTDHPLLTQGLPAGVRFVRKPFTQEDLCREVRSALDAA